MQKIKIFLASSEELKAEREQFEIAIYRKCKSWFEKGVFVHLDIWEDLSAKMSTTRSQDEYNKEIREADIFVLLAFSKVGIYTAEEFEQAFGQFKSTKKPFIFTYFKEIEANDSTEYKSLVEFWQKIRDLKHFYCKYKDFNDLWNQFNKELDRLELTGFVENKKTKEAKITRKIKQGDKSVYIEKGGDDMTLNIQ